VLFSRECYQVFELANEHELVAWGHCIPEQAFCVRAGAVARSRIF